MRLPEDRLQLMLALVLGLGNIGERYKNSRHNLGFRVVERLLAPDVRNASRESGVYCWWERQIASAKIILATPTTYMNRSGQAARVLLQENDLSPSQMLVVVDDINLPLGKIRIRTSGSDGGHNGLASVIEQLQTEDFPRLRLGIGPLPDNEDQVEFVLGDFDKSETEIVEKMIITASEAAIVAIEQGLDEAMSKYNQNPA